MSSPDRFKLRMRAMVLETKTVSGRTYNAVVFGAILLSVLALMMDPNPLSTSIYQRSAVGWIYLIQNSCLAVFAVDFLLNLYVSERPLKYLFSFYGLIDLLAIVFFVIPQIRSEILLWIFKFGRILRVFKLLRFIDEAKVLGAALQRSARTIVVYLFFVFMLQVVLGYFIFVIESVNPDSPFKTMGNGVYWAIVTMTTVGYGDYVPQTALGRLLASVVMMLGFGIIAIPTGILTYSGVRQQRQESMASQCPACGRSGHRNDAVHCDRCGALLRDHKSSSV